MGVPRCQHTSWCPLRSHPAPVHRPAMAIRGLRATPPVPASRASCSSPGDAHARLSPSGRDAGPRAVWLHTGSLLGPARLRISSGLPRSARDPRSVASMRPSGRQGSATTSSAAWIAERAATKAKAERGKSQWERNVMVSQFDSTRHAYERSMEQMPFRQHVEAHSFLKAIGDVKGRSVLDLGCGTGWYARRLSAQGAARVVGVDESQAMIACARRQLVPRVTYVVGDARSPIPALAGGFDVVTAMYVLPYMPTRQALLDICETARHALRPEGGRFLVMTLNPHFSTQPNWYRRYGMTLLARDPQREGSPGHLSARVDDHVIDVDFFCWSADAHEQALRQAGFSAISWHHPDVSDEGLAAYGAKYWHPYLATPHALIIDAIAGPRADSTDAGGRW
ncbi:class I SAM-dependent methyltransferase [Streptomyces sp. NPDC051582]|uniref:class I SAM-dependent methyltransferase n=1 Tax=Streptomyces sp. NPDC051582 TaxID=3155167 RepID=UPI0034267700